MRPLSILLLIVVVITACNTTKRNTAQSTASLQGEWLITSVNNEEIKAFSDTPFIGFNTPEMRMYGNSSCNLMNAQMKIEKGEAIRFSAMASTRRLCHEDRYEQPILQALHSVRRYQIQESDKLVLQDSIGTHLLTLKRR